MQQKKARKPKAYFDARDFLIEILDISEDAHERFMADLAEILEDRFGQEMRHGEMFIGPLKTEEQRARGLSIWAADVSITMSKQMRQSIARFVEAAQNRIDGELEEAEYQLFEANFVAPFTWWPDAKKLPSRDRPEVITYEEYR